MTDRCTILYTGILQHHAANTQMGKRADINTCRDNIRKRIALHGCLLIYSRPNLIISNAGHEIIVVSAYFSQVGNTANNRYSTYHSTWPLSIINKCTIISGYRLLCCHATKTACPNQQ